MNISGKKVLITGADGFIGSHLTEALVAKGAKVKAFVYYNSFNSWGWLDTLPKHILNEIEQLPAGFETMVGERGTTLSGGQKQRISIARALIKEPDLFIFDDCLSAVDANTEKTILSNLSRLMQDKTALFITHRIFFNFHFDHIIYIENGRIAESGTHESLLAKQGLYADLYDTQLSQNQQ